MIATLYPRLILFYVLKKLYLEVRKRLKLTLAKFILYLESLIFLRISSEIQSRSTRHRSIYFTVIVLKTVIRDHEH
jgi:hypothetical protein